MAVVQRTFGLPFKGFNAAKKRWQCDLNELTGDSYDWLIDPVEGKLLRRGGSYLLGQAIKDANEVTLQFESGPTYGDLYARQIVELRSDAITDGLPTHGVLYGNDNTAGLLSWMSPNTYTVADCSMVSGTNTLTTTTADGFEDVTLGVQIQVPGLGNVAQVIAINSTISVDLSMEADGTITNQTATIGGTTHGLHLTIGKRYGSFHYPNNQKVIPVPGIFNRLISAADRAKVMQGSRRVVSVGRWTFAGNGTSGGQAIRYNRDWNDRLSSGTRNERVFLMGNQPPLTFKVGVGSTDVTDGVKWKADAVYFFTVIYKFSDGSYSMPWVPRDKNPVGPDPSAPVRVLGRWKVPVDAGSLLYTLPLGPDGCVERLVARSVAGTEDVPPPLLDANGKSLLGICAQIKNNTQDQYYDPNGNDANLVFDPTIVRFDLVHPPPTRFLWGGDQRIWGAGIKPSNAAIYLSSGETGDDDSLSGASHRVLVTSVAGLATSILFEDGVSDAPAITLAQTKTIQDVVDEINSNLVNVAYCAQLVPGADPNARSDYLYDTTVHDYGDGNSAGSFYLRSYGNTWPCMLPMNATYLNGLPARENAIWFTTGGPGTAPYSPNIGIKNFREGLEGWGFAMGGAPLREGQIVCFSECIATCRNIRDGKTGDDDDYRLEALNESRGCISDATIASGSDWVTYATRDGIIVTDGVREVLISMDLYNPATGRGILAEAIRNCLAALGTRQGEACARYLTAWVADSKIYLGVAHTAVAPQLAYDPVLVYDFSEGAAASGLAQVLGPPSAGNPHGTPYGWSAAQSLASAFPGVRTALMGGAIGRSKDSGPGRRMVVASSYLSASAASTPHGVIGRIFEPTGMDLMQLDQDGATHAGTATISSAVLTAVAGDLSRIAVGATVIESGTTRLRRGSVVTAVDAAALTVTLDRTAKSSGAVTVFFQGKDVEPVGYGATDMAGTTNMKSLRKATALYNQAGTGMQVLITNELDRTGQQTFNLDAAASADGFSRQRLNLNQKNRGLAKAYEPVFKDTGTTTQESEFWGLEAEVEILDSHR